MLFWANTGGSVAVTASIVVCVPPVSGVGAVDVGGMFPSMLVLAQLLRMKVAAAKAIRYRARVGFTVSVGMGEVDISVLFFIRRKGLRVWRCADDARTLPDPNYGQRNCLRDN